MEINHNVVVYIKSLYEKYHEIVMDCVNALKKHTIKFLEEEKHK